MLNDEPSNEGPLSPPAVQRDIILGLLLTLTVLAWAALFWQRANADAGMAMASPTMSLRGPPFLTIWLVMMAAMMFPGAAPMVLTFHQVHARKRKRHAFLSTSVFVA